MNSAGWAPVAVSAPPGCATAIQGATSRLLSTFGSCTHRPAPSDQSLSLSRRLQGLSCSFKLDLQCLGSRVTFAGARRASWQAVRPWAGNPRDAKSRVSQRQSSKTPNGREAGREGKSVVLRGSSPVIPEALLPQAPLLSDSQAVPTANDSSTNGTASSVNGTVSETSPKRPPIGPKLSTTSAAPSILEIWWRRAVRQLASFPLAIGLLFAIAGLASVGTIIEQGESLQTYMEYYPEETPLFGFLTWRVVVGLSLDHIYTAPSFLALLALLASSLVACTATRQWPMVRVAQRWVFVKRPEPILKLETADTLQNARVGDLATLLAANGFEVFLQGPTLYAFKGLLGRVAPIGVHAALLLVMGGGLYSAIGGYRGTSMTPQGLDFFVGDALVPNGILSRPSSSMNLRVRVNQFSIDYRPDGQVKQFFSDLSIVDLDEREVYRKTISVNDPLRCRGVTLYQTDWAIAAVQVQVDDSGPLSLPMATLNEPGSSQKLYGTFLPLGEEGLTQGRGISILARDLQTVVVYDTQGQFVGVRRPGSGRPITVEGVTLVFDQLVGSTGMELKMDPSVPYVYTGFGALMLTSAVSYLSHSQVWALQEGSTLYVGGKSNRARLSFKKDLDDLLDLVPEVSSGDSPGEASNGEAGKAEGGRGRKDDAYAAT